MTRPMLTEAQSGRIDRLEEIIRVIVASAKHGPHCAFPANGGPATICRCGLQKVFDQVDELIE